MVSEESTVTSTHAAETAVANAAGLVPAGLGRCEARMKGERMAGIARMARAPCREQNQGETPGPNISGLRRAGGAGKGKWREGKGKEASLEIGRRASGGRGEGRHVCPPAFTRP